MAASRLLIIVRHAQSEHHVLGLSGGWTDTPLTALGQAQAARVAGRLAPPNCPDCQSIVC